MKTQVIHIIGCSGTGKTSLIDGACEMYLELIGQIDVGKQLRKRYPPKHFQGRGAPDSTEQEAFSIYQDMLEDYISVAKRVVLVSGQPRRISQVRKIYDLQDAMRHLADFRYILLDAIPPVRMNRTNVRDSGNVANLALNKQRHVNDMIDGYSVLIEMLKCRMKIEVVDAGGPMSELPTWIDTLMEAFLSGDPVQ